MDPVVIVYNHDHSVHAPEEDIERLLVELENS